MSFRTLSGSVFPKLLLADLFFVHSSMDSNCGDHFRLFHLNSSCSVVLSSGWNLLTKFSLILFHSAIVLCTSTPSSFVGVRPM